MKSQKPEMFPIIYSQSTSHWMLQRAPGKKRKSGNTTGCLYLANPIEGERFFLRLWFHHSPGCKSFQDFLTLENGTVCATYKETALKSGFLQSDDEWIECLREAALSGSPCQLRLLFATILLFCEPAEPVKLWNELYFQLSDDVRRCKDNHSDEITLYKTLLLIDDQLKAHGQTLHSFPEMSELFATVPSNIHDQIS